MTARLTPDQERAIADAYRTGAQNIGDLRAHYHIGALRVHAILKAAGISIVNSGFELHRQRTAARKLQMAAMYASGQNVLDIARAMRVSRQWVQHVLRDAGYDLPYAPRARQVRCRCCGILLAESGDARHWVEDHDGVCGDCFARYVQDAGVWRPREDYVLEMEPLEMAGDIRVAWTPGWAMIEEEA
jgi:hypothetical protein